VTLTRVQMQNAADAAAIEGLRHRDAVIDETTGTVDAYASDCVRRIAARDIVRWTFDDDFNAGTSEVEGDVNRQLGAGPVFDLTEGTGNLEALRTLSLPAQRPTPADNVYKPNLQYNQTGNVAYGDMVSGTFIYNASPAFDENADYTRTDFVPSPAVPQGASLVPCPEEAPMPGPASGVSPLDTPSFLVRLRRTWNPDGLDGIVDESDPSGSNGISSNGGSLPLLFGAGTHVSEDPDDPRGYSVRRDGLTVRGTAIAHVRPALRAGAAVLEPPVAPSVLQIVAVPGVTPFAITDVAPLTLDTAVVAAIDMTGSISVGGGEVAHFVGPVHTMTVGDPLPPPVAPLCDPTAPTNAASPTIWFGPQFDATQLLRFVPIQFTWDCAAPASITITRRSQIVAPANASALLPEGLPAGASFPPLAADTLLAPVRAR
jgi:hypothetical protein